MNGSAQCNGSSAGTRIARNPDRDCKNAGRTCYACGREGACCSIMAGVLGGAVSSFVTCERCQGFMLEQVAGWVAEDPERRWVTLGVAQRWAWRELGVQS